MGNKGKYAAWGNFLKTRREARFKSARELCRVVSIGISYPQYSRYESGDQLPSLEQALSLAAIFGVPALEMVIEWTLAQMPAHSPEGAAAQGELMRLLESTRAPANGTPQGPAAKSPAGKRFTQGVALDDVIVFNRSHLKVFGSDPAYRDVFTYINAFGGGSIGAGEIAQALGLGESRVAEMLEQLSDLGVVHLKDGLCRSAKRILYFPDDEDFFELRNFNFKHNAERILADLSHRDVVDRKAFRGLITRELTAAQAAQLMGGLENVLAQAVAMPESSEARAVYSLCALFGERFSRAELAAQEAAGCEEGSGSGIGPGLTTHLPETQVSTEISATATRTNGVTRDSK